MRKEGTRSDSGLPRDPVTVEEATSAPSIFSVGSHEPPTDEREAGRTFLPSQPQILVSKHRTPGVPSLSKHKTHGVIYYESPIPERTRLYLPF